jgi:ergothioneine biosynthesis protein EgtB
MNPPLRLRGDARAEPRAPRTRCAALAQRFMVVRARSAALAAPLSEADCQPQSMPDASPVKWHLAHTTWFFETFVLERYERDFTPFNAAFKVLFNSYYQAVGAQHPRPQRGLVTRPGLAQVLDYRGAVDERVQTLLSQPDSRDEMLELIELGVQHEQQHQELIVTDLKHLLSCNPLDPVYESTWPLATVSVARHGWVGFDGGLVTVGQGGDGFVFDNESPEHRVWLEPYALGDRLVTHDEWLAFVDDGGYRDARWWLSAGWDWVNEQAIEAPLYWRNVDGAWHSFTLHGLVPIDTHTPIVHVSHYEADAYAHWLAAQTGEPIRLPTEFEWEHAARLHEARTRPLANFVESKALHPMPLAKRYAGVPMQLFGDVWEWTSSSYAPYPGFRAEEGAVGEYNGKFMANQYVLRGGSCATPADHVRASYRNFFPSTARWQFSGVRLARDGGPR